MAVLATLSLLAACGSPAQAMRFGPSPDSTNSTQETGTMSEGPSVSRPPPPDVPPVEIGGVRYAQDMSSYSHGGDQPGGYLEAIDVKTGQRLWSLKVYDLARSPSDVDVIGLYFKSMRAAAGHHALEIENEAGFVYRVDLAARTSTLIHSPPSQQMPPIKPPEPPPGF